MNTDDWKGRVVVGDPVARIVNHCRLLGCTCDPPGVRFIDGSPPRYGGVSNVEVSHDDGCPLGARGGTDVSLTMPPRP